MIYCIRPNIYLSNAVEATEITKKDPVTAVLNVAVEIYNPRLNHVQWVKSAMMDNAQDAMTHTEEAVDSLGELLEAGHVVLVHCRQGKSRSPHVIAAYLSRYEQKPYCDVYNEIRQICPRVMYYSLGQEIQDKFGMEWNGNEN